MVSVNPNPAQGFYFYESPGATCLPGLNENCQTVPFAAEDKSKKIRKPYTITKCRESWTDQEHDKFLEALQLFDRDWKKIEAFVGSKTVIQIRSHAQKYFLKIQKSGATEHVPPPRPKRKAAHPYPQKAPKSAAPVISQGTGAFQTSSGPLEPVYIYTPDASSITNNGALPAWAYNSVHPVSLLQVQDEAALAGPAVAYNACCGTSNENILRTCQTSKLIDQGDQDMPVRVMPDFPQVYSFIGSVFDPNARGHLERLEDMDPINLETTLQLMKNLAINIQSPEFEDHMRLITSADVNVENPKIYINARADMPTTTAA